MPEQKNIQLETNAFSDWKKIIDDIKINSKPLDDNAKLEVLRALSEALNSSAQILRGSGKNAEKIKSAYGEILIGISFVVSKYFEKDLAAATNLYNKLNLIFGISSGNDLETVVLGKNEKDLKKPAENFLKQIDGLRTGASKYVEELNTDISTRLNHDAGKYLAAYDKGIGIVNIWDTKTRSERLALFIKMGILVKSDAAKGKEKNGDEYRNLEFDSGNKKVFLDLYNDIKKMIDEGKIPGIACYDDAIKKIQKEIEKKGEQTDIFKAYYGYLCKKHLINCNALLIREGATEHSPNEALSDGNQVKIQSMLAEMQYTAADIRFSLDEETQKLVNNIVSTSNSLAGYSNWDNLVQFASLATTLDTALGQLMEADTAASLARNPGLKDSVREAIISIYECQYLNVEQLKNCGMVFDEPKQNGEKKKAKAESINYNKVGDEVKTFANRVIQAVVDINAIETGMGQLMFEGKIKERQTSAADKEGQKDKKPLSEGGIKKIIPKLGKNKNEAEFAIRAIYGNDLMPVFDEYVECGILGKGEKSTFEANNHSLLSKFQALHNALLASKSQDAILKSYYTAADNNHNEYAAELLINSLPVVVAVDTTGISIPYGDETILYSRPLGMFSVIAGINFLKKDTPFAQLKTNQNVSPEAVIQAYKDFNEDYYLFKSVFDDAIKGKINTKSEFVQLFAESLSAMRSRLKSVESAIGSDARVAGEITRALDSLETDLGAEAIWERLQNVEGTNDILTKLAQIDVGVSSLANMIYPINPACSLIDKVERAKSPYGFSFNIFHNSEAFEKAFPDLAVYDYQNRQAIANKIFDYAKNVHDLSPISKIVGETTDKSGGKKEIFEYRMDKMGRFLKSVSELDFEDTKRILPNFTEGFIIELPNGGFDISTQGITGPREYYSPYSQDALSVFARHLGYMPAGIPTGIEPLGQNMPRESTVPSYMARLAGQQKSFMRKPLELVRAEQQRHFSPDRMHVTTDASYVFSQLQKTYYEIMPPRLVPSLWVPDQISGGAALSRTRYPDALAGFGTVSTSTFPSSSTNTDAFFRSEETGSAGYSRKNVSSDINNYRMFGNFVMDRFNLTARNVSEKSPEGAQIKFKAVDSDTRIALDSSPSQDSNLVFLFNRNYSQDEVDKAEKHTDMTAHSDLMKIYYRFNSSWVELIFHDDVKKDLEFRKDLVNGIVDSIKGTDLEKNLFFEWAQYGKEPNVRLGLDIVRQKDTAEKMNFTNAGAYLGFSVNPFAVFGAVTPVDRTSVVAGTYENEARLVTFATYNLPEKQLSDVASQGYLQPNYYQLSNNRYSRHYKPEKMEKTQVTSAEYVGRVASEADLLRVALSGGERFLGIRGAYQNEGYLSGEGSRLSGYAFVKYGDGGKATNFITGSYGNFQNWPLSYLLQAQKSKYNDAEMVQYTGFIARRAGGVDFSLSGSLSDPKMFANVYNRTRSSLKGFGYDVLQARFDSYKNTMDNPSSTQRQKDKALYDLRNALNDVFSYGDNHLFFGSNMGWGDHITLSFSDHKTGRPNGALTFFQLENNKKRFCSYVNPTTGFATILEFEVGSNDKINGKGAGFAIKKENFKSVVLVSQVPEEKKPYFIAQVGLGNTAVTAMKAGPLYKVQVSYAGQSFVGILEGQHMHEYNAVVGKAVKYNKDFRYALEFGLMGFEAQKQLSIGAEVSKVKAFLNKAGYYSVGVRRMTGHDLDLFGGGEWLFYGKVGISL